MTVVGLVGLGRMGSAMARRLLDRGVEVVAWARNPAATKAFGDSRLEVADSPRALAERADLIVTIITEDSGVRNLFCGADGFLEADLRGRLVVEMSTLRPATGRELATLAAEAGAGFLDAPVLGSIPTVTDGKLVALVGGSAADVASARPLFDLLTRRVFHLGPSGTGYAMKLAVNLGLANYIELLGEALALGAGHGLPLDVMIEVLGESPIAAPWLAMKKAVLAGGTSPTTLDLRTMRKDIMSAVAAGASNGVPLPATSATLATVSAAVAAGRGEQDIGDLPRFLREAMRQTY